MLGERPVFLAFPSTSLAVIERRHDRVVEYLALAKIPSKKILHTGQLTLAGRLFSKYRKFKTHASCL
jgi:hypothetical protein